MMTSVIAVFGNPLLDIYIVTDNKIILDKFNFQESSKAEITKEEFNIIYKYITEHYELQYRAGGSAQNTSQILQWIMHKHPRFVTFFGGIGNDDQGIQLQKLMEKANISTRYNACRDHITGNCIVIVTNESSTFLAHVGAAKDYKLSYLKSVPDNMKIINEVEMIYIEGFFISHRLPVVDYLYNFSISNSKLFIFNLNAVYLFDEIKDQMNFFALNCDILFGNIHEYQALCESLQICDKKISKNIALYLNHNYKSKKNHKYSAHKKIVVITDGPNPVICVSGDKQYFEIDVPKISSTKVKDTSGAGDSFVAGFLAALFLGKSLPLCVKWGCWTAGKIIQEVGCITPRLSPEELYYLT